MSTLCERASQRSTSDADRRWQHHYAALVQYVDANGHASPPVHFVSADGTLLGKWVVTQRQKRRQGRLREERVIRLAALPGWVWDVYLSWEHQYAVLVRFCDDTGHACPAVNHEMEDGYRLGKWVGYQRKRYRQGRLRADRAARLAALPGWVWHIDNPSEYESAWEQAFSALQAFADIHGHAQPPFRGRGEPFRLGVWVHKQRKAYRDGRLGAERAHRLEALPEWTWVGQRGNHPKGSVQRP